MSGPEDNQTRQTPTRLAEQGGPLGLLLAEAAAESAQVPASARARVWRRLQEPAKPISWRLPLAAGGLAAACAVVFAILLPEAPPRTLALSLVPGAGSVALVDPAGGVQPGTTSFADRSQIVAGTAGALLRSGGSQLALSAGARATFREAEGITEVWLESGEAAVGPVDGSNAPATIRVVAAGAYRVEAPPGALFIVSASAERVSVYAVRGEAKVHSAAGDQPVSAGAAWASQGVAPAVSEAERTLAARAAPAALAGTPSAASAPTPAGPTVAPSSGVPSTVAPAASLFGQGSGSPARTGRLLARAAESAASQGDEAALAKVSALEAAGDNPAAAGILEELSKKSGPRAEAALYELGRLRLRFLGQPALALAAFDEHARRFPEGALALEARLTAVEARLSLGQDEPALREMDSFLARYGQSERALDVRWLRASLLQGRGDCRRALPDLRALSEEGPRSEGALFLLATCARSGGDLAEAKARLTEYQRRFPGGAHRAEVDAALRGGEGR